MRSLNLAGALLLLTASTGPAMAQQVVPAPQDPERSLRDARAIVEAFGRPDSATVRDGGVSARAETGQSWTPSQQQQQQRSPATGSIASLTDTGAAGGGAPATATSRIGASGGSRAPRAPSRPVVARPARGAAAGGGTINATAERITTIATGGTAITDIGVGGSGRSSTSAKDVVTLGAGEDSTTRIGGCSGTVSAQNVYNLGGDMEICAGGIKRDGMNCVEIYRDTCIVHAYTRPKKSPCAPLYWTDFRRCRLPSDYKHAIRN